MKWFSRVKLRLEKMQHYDNFITASGREVNIRRLGSNEAKNLKLGSTTKVHTEDGVQEYRVQIE